MAYATYSDIEARWRPLTTEEQTHATTLCDDASAIIDSLTEVQDVELARIVTCNMVIRAMSAAPDSYGLSQSSMTAGPYTQSWTYSNPSGDMYLTKLEKRMLGITGGYIGSIRPCIRGGLDD